MTRFRIFGTEMYPVMILLAEDGIEEPVEIPEALVARYDAVATEFLAVQQALAELRFPTSTVRLWLDIPLSTAGR